MSILSRLLTIGVVVVWLCLPPAVAAELDDRWGFTASTPGPLVLGDPTHVTWGLVADGTPISAGLGGGESNDPSSLISFLDTNIGAGGGGADLTQRPWFFIFNDSFNRLGQVSGLSYSYEPNDDGQAIDSTTLPRGQLGVRADVRIGGHSIDGQQGNNALAYNYFPDHGDMVIDTDNVNFYSNNNNNYIRFRNTVMHEGGHGVGISHGESNTHNFLMEPAIGTGFDGPQFDDVLQLNRGYGDPLEKNGGNDSAATASDLGTIADGQTNSVGNDADDFEVASTDTDFVSIDGSTDTDFYRFTINSAGLVDVLLDPLGPTYNRRRQGESTYNSFNAAMQSDLLLEVFDTDGSTSLGLSNSTGLGGSESILGLNLLAGTYFAQVSGTQDATQFYRLSASFNSAVPEPGTLGSLAVIGLIAGGYRLRRRLVRKPVAIDA